MTATDATEPGTEPADDTSTDVAPAHRHPKAHQRAGRLGRWIDSRTGIARVGRGALNKVFPNHWSFLLGEIALYSFVVLLLTGIYLTLFFDADSTGMTTYDGSYGPMQGVQVSEAYNSALEISFDVKGGLLVRQIHHWAALVFVGAIVLHLCRVFFTGAFRRPRELNWVVGCTLFMLAVVNGFAGYSLLDDQLSGTGLRIGYSVLISIPVIGPWLGSLIFGGNFPGDDVIARLYPIHILVVPLLIIAMLTVHLTVLIRHKHTHFPARALATTTSWASACGRPTCSRPVRCSSACSVRWRCSAASPRSTRCGSTGRSAPRTCRRPASPTGTWAGWRERCA
ncbi:MAG: cytochrome b [Acidimicrobiales bacterium]